MTTRGHPARDTQPEERVLAGLGIPVVNWAELTFLERSTETCGLYDDELFTEEKGNARVYLPVRESAELGRIDARWDLPAGRYAVALHTGAHDDADRAYAAVGAYAGKTGRDGTGPVREHYLVSTLDTPDAARWQTEICWPLASARGMPEACQ